MKKIGNPFGLSSANCWHEIVIDFSLRYNIVVIIIIINIITIIIIKIVMISACGATLWSSSLSSTSSPSSSSRVWWFQPAVRHCGLPSTFPLRAAALLDKTDLCARYWRSSSFSFFGSFFSQFFCSLWLPSGLYRLPRSRNPWGRICQNSCPVCGEHWATIITTMSIIIRKRQKFALYVSFGQLLLGFFIFIIIIIIVVFVISLFLPLLTIIINITFRYKSWPGQLLKPGWFWLLNMMNLFDSQY